MLNYQRARSRAALIMALGVAASAVAPVVMPTPAAAQTINFNDVKPGHWAKSFIEALAQKAIIKGSNDGSFRPDAPVTRAEYATMILKAFKKPKAGDGAAFADVPKTHWALSAIQAASGAGFLSGYPGKIFKPEQKIPRAEVLLSLANGLKYATSGSPQKALEGFKDSAAIPEFARNSIAAAAEKKLIVYPNATELNPDRTATRAEVAASIYQALVNDGQAPAITSSDTIATVKPDQTSAAIAAVNPEQTSQNLTQGVGGGSAPVTIAASINSGLSPALQPVITPVQAKTILYVNPALGTDTSSRGTSEAAPYRTLTYALKQAQPGTLIQLAPGNYTQESGEIFPIVIKSGVILRGNESTFGKNVLISGGAAYQTQTFRVQNISVQAEKDSQIRGVTITNPKSRGTALWIESTNPTVQNNTFIKSLREGIFVTGSAAPKITNNVFTENTANGISVAREAQGEIRNNVFQNTGFGMAIGDSSAPTVIGNQVMQNKDGIVISHTSRPMLRQNIIENNMRSGVVAISDAQPDLGTTTNPGNNIIRNNGQHDLYNVTSSETLMTTGNQIGTMVRGKVGFPSPDAPGQTLQTGQTQVAPQ